MNAHELKALKTQYNKLSAEYNTAKEDVERTMEISANIKKRLNDLRIKIEEIQSNSKDIIVTEHAQLRYIERVIGIDLVELKEKILPKETRELIDKALRANGKYPAGEHRVVISDKTVVTVEV